MKVKVWVFNTPPKNAIEFVSSSLKAGFSRFGWSYSDMADLKMMNEKGWSNLSTEEQKCWKKTWFLLEIESGDWIVHVNVPGWGKCTAGKVKAGYEFDKESGIGDFRHMIELDSTTIITFDRNDPNVLPYISRRLKLQGHYWKIRDNDRFLKSIENLKNGTVQLDEKTTAGLFHLKSEIKPQLSKITSLIHENHPGKKLEEFMCKVLENIPGVNNVKMNGSGRGTDYGADLIVRYTSGLPITDLQTEETLVVQIKSFAGIHYSTNVVKEIEIAIKKYEASAGLIISTAVASDELIEKVERLRLDINKPVGLICGEEVAAFVLKYGLEHVI